MKNLLAVKFLEKILVGMDKDEKINFLSGEADLVFDSGFNYLPIFYCFNDDYRYVVAKATFDGLGDLEEIECFSGVEHPLRLAVNDCDIDASDLYLHDLDLYFNYAKSLRLETIINYELSQNYEIIEDCDASLCGDLIYVVKDRGIYKVVDYDTYCMSDFKEAILIEKD